MTAVPVDNGSVNVNMPAVNVNNGFVYVNIAFVSLAGTCCNPNNAIVDVDMAVVNVDNGNVNVVFPTGIFVGNKKDTILLHSFT